MIKETAGYDSEIYPAYGCINDEVYKKVQPKYAPKIIYVIKANGGLNSKIHSNVFSMIHSGRVDFLIKEQDARRKILATKVGQKMSIEDRTKRLMPHEMTTSLMNEMLNLRLKQTDRASGEIALEMINPNQLKDKFSSLEYTLWRVKELEDAEVKNWRKRPQNGKKRQLTFFYQGR